MGLRSVVDMICNDRVGDIGGFKEKLESLEGKGLISKKKHEMIEVVLEVGHASMHRGYFPLLEDLRTILSIVDHLLEDIYVLDKTSEFLKASTPRRSAKRRASN